MIRERAPAKVNLLLQVGPARADGLHELCSLFASIELADELEVVEAPETEDVVACPGVAGPNLCHAALAAFRAAAPKLLPPLEVRVAKRIPVAAGLGGGSADAAAVLRAANEIARLPLDAAALRRVAASVGADVPSQVEPRHALVLGGGEVVEPVELPPMGLALIPSSEGLATGDVYREADRIGATRASLDAGAARVLARGPLEQLARGLENDLQAAALSLRPQLGGSIEALAGAGALAALLTGSGPTAFGVFADEASAASAAAGLPGALAVALA